MKTFVIWLSQWNSGEILLILFAIVFGLIVVGLLLYGIFLLIKYCFDCYVEKQIDLYIDNKSLEHYVDVRVAKYFQEYCKKHKFK